jgi:hypothetical protein
MLPVKFYLNPILMLAMVFAANTGAAGSLDEVVDSRFYTATKVHPVPDQDQGHECFPFRQILKSCMIRAFLTGGAGSARYFCIAYVRR